MDNQKFEGFLLLLSRIVTEPKAFELIANRLGLESHTADAIARNKVHDGIPDACHEALKKWRRGNMETDVFKLIDQLRSAFQGEVVNLGGAFENVVRKEYGQQQLQRPPQEKQKSPQASGSDDVDASPEGGKRKEEDSGEEVHETLRNADPVDSSVCLVYPPDGGKSLEECLKESVPDIESYPKKAEVGRVVIINNDYKKNSDGDYVKAVEDNTDYGEVNNKTNNPGYLQGYQKDVDTITDVLKVTGFKDDQIKVYRNQSYNEISKILTDTADEEDCTNYSCICCFFLSHGTDKGTLTTPGGKDVEIRELTSYFKQLKGTPKLFFIQACHGTGKEDVSELFARPANVVTSKSFSLEADIFEFYAAPLGYVSWVHPISGSTFIQCLCHVLKHAAEGKRFGLKTNIFEIATKTNRMISQVITKGEEMKKTNGKETKDIRDYAQVAMVNSTLTANFYF